MTPVIHWFRRDLRLSDNTALNAALATGAPVIPVFIFDPALLKGERFSAGRLQFLLNGLESLDADLQRYGSGLVIRSGDPRIVLSQLLAETDAAAITFNNDVTPYAQRRDAAILRSLPAQAFDDVLIHAPNAILKDDGKPYTVYTPFRKRWENLPKPVAAPLSRANFHPLDGMVRPSIAAMSTTELRRVTIQVPAAGEAVALRRLERFTADAIYHYADERNCLVADPFSDPGGTSGLSPYLRFGMVSARQAYHAAARRLTDTDAFSANERQSIQTWISELAWRDFYAHILYFFPHVLERSFKPEYDQLEYRAAPDEFERWAAGMTGYPVVDAAMRQLNALGWMHNRARMIVASFLTKDLLIHWRRGDLHFMRHLIDGDPAANNGGWQWSAGTGTDAQPFFRIFNPVTQSQQYDPNGAYIRAWVPELRDVPASHIHAPWMLPTAPTGYPSPMVDHAAARQRALAAFATVTQRKTHYES